MSLTQKPSLSVSLTLLAFAIVCLFARIGVSAPAESSLAPFSAAHFDTIRAMHHVQVLASDSLQGRYGGFEGGEKAARYIANHYKAIGLEAPFGKDGYFQPFTYPEGDYKAPSYLAFRYPDGRVDTAHFWQDINIYKGSGIGHAVGKIVFLGFGVSAPDKGWDDYDGVDVKGCVILAIRGTPSAKGVRWNDEGIAARKAIQAKKHGAIGFMQIDTDPIRMPGIDGMLSQPDFPVFNLSKKFADTLLVRESGRNSDDYRKDLAKGHVHLSCNAIADLMISGRFYPKRQLMNVAGLLPASDSKNRKELIVLGAHYDHHGTDPAGNVYHGGNDNASGDAVVMELAEQFAKSRKHYNRSILFLNFTGEEEGLVGSKEFVKELATNGYHVAAMINMDVVGTGGDTLGIGGIAEQPEIGLAINDSLPEAIRKNLVYWRLYPGSDHTSFDEEGIPAFVIGTIGGEYPTYHTPNDTAGTVIPSSLAKVGDLVYRMTVAATELPDVLIRNQYDQSPPHYDEFRKEYQFVHKTGMVDFTTRGGVDNRFYSKEPLKGIRPLYPMDIVEMSLDDSHWNPSDQLLSELEKLHENTVGVPYLADSARKDFPRVDAFRGLMVSPAFQGMATTGSQGIRSLQKLGVTFTFLDADNGDCFDMNGMPKPSVVNFEKVKTNLIPIIESMKPERIEQVIPKLNEQSFESKLAVRLPLTTIDTAIVAQLAGQVGLIIFDANKQIMNDTPDAKQVAERIKLLLANRSVNKLVISVGKHPEIIRECWRAGISNYDLQNLLYFNFKNFMEQYYPSAPEPVRHY